MTNNPLYEIDNSQQIMVITGDNEWDHKVLIESFLQANVKSRTRYKCCMLYHCHRENKLTLDTYYIVKSIIYNILRCCPSLENYFKLHGNYEFLREMTDKFGKEKEDLQREHANVLLKFFKVLSEMELDYNIAIFITGIDNLYTKAEQSRFDSFIVLLRICSLHFPRYLKIVLTMEKRANGDKILELLGTRNVLEINDSEMFEIEGKSYLDFALGYGGG